MKDFGMVRYNATSYAWVFTKVFQKQYPYDIIKNDNNPKSYDMEIIIGAES